MNTTVAPPTPQVGVRLPVATPANTDTPTHIAEQQPTELTSFWRQMALSSPFDGPGLSNAAFSAGERAVRELAAETSGPKGSDDSAA